MHFFCIFLSKKFGKGNLFIVSLQSVRQMDCKDSKVRKVSKEREGVRFPESGVQRTEDGGLKTGVQRTEDGGSGGTGRTGGQEWRESGARVAD